MLAAVKRFVVRWIGHVLWYCLEEQHAEIITRQASAITATLDAHKRWLRDQGFSGAVDVNLRDGGAVIVMARGRTGNDFVKIIPMYRRPMTAHEWRDFIKSIETQYAVRFDYIDSPGTLPTDYFRY